MAEDNNGHEPSTEPEISRAGTPIKDSKLSGEARDKAQAEAVGEAERIRNEEYKIWKKQSPFLYDLCISRAMMSPSVSVQWFPAKSPYASVDEGGPFDTYSLMLTDKGEMLDYPSAYRAEVDLPSKQFSKQPPSQSQRQGVRKVADKEAWGLPPHEVPLVARLSPESPELIAVAGKSGDVLIVGKSDAQTTLKGHQASVYDLSWRGTHSVASASGDGQVKLWDLASSKATHSLRVPSGAVNCVQYAPLNESELGSAGDDRVIRFWDARQGTESRIITDAHATPVTAMHYNPHNEMLLATASADGAIAIWDVRMSSASLAGLSTGPASFAINALRWSPFDVSVLASGGADCHVKVWDLSLHGQDQTAAEEQEGPPELIFIHGGHLGAVTDLDWHPSLPWTLSSVGEDNIASVWRIASAIVDKI